MTSWTIGALASVVLAVAYLAIGGTILRGLRLGGQLATNRLGLATACIFLTCGAGHAAHLGHIVRLMGAGVAGEATLRAIYDWHLVLVDVTTAGVAVWYWTLRSQYRRLLTRPALFEDLDDDRRRALELNDAVVQELATARYALQLQEPALAAAAVDRALEQATDIVRSALRQAGDLADEPALPSTATAPVAAVPDLAPTAATAAEAPQPGEPGGRIR